MRKALLAVAALLLLAATAGPAAARFGMPDALTERGRTVESIYTQIAVAGTLVFILVFVLLVWVLVRYREGGGKGRATHERHRGSLAAELTWTLIPLAIVLWVGYIAYVGLVDLDKEEPGEPELSVTVTGFQWAWEMDYGQGVKVLVNPSADANGVMSYTDTFHLPADTPFRLNVTGADVIHAFNLMDGNRAFVSMDDANPLGPHKVITRVLELPAGTYSIQCKEMCLNPGHAYMRAELVVEPREDFDLWLSQRAACAGEELCQTLQVTLDADGMASPAANETNVVNVVAGTQVVLVLANTHTEPIDVRLPGNASTVTVPAGASVVEAFGTAVEGDFVVEASNGGRLTFRSVAADETIEVELGEFRLVPDHLDLDAGKTYLIRAVNTHGISHNLYIAPRGSGYDGDDAVARSETIATGATSFFWTAEAGEWDLWCDVSGHDDLGMVGTATVTVA